MTCKNMPLSPKKSPLLSPKFLSIGLLSVSLLACAPVVHNRGYVFNSETLEQVTKGVSTKDMVRSIMGSPSSVASIDGKTYYYIASRFETYTYRTPKETARRIAAIYFDDNDVVQNIAHYGLQDGNIVDFIKRETITRGKELTLLDQLFGNIGRFSSSEGGDIPGSQR